MTAGADAAAAIGDVLAEWADTGYWPPAAVCPHGKTVHFEDCPTGDP